MQGKSLPHTCFRPLVQVNDRGDFAVPGEAGVLGLLAYNTADVLSAMKLSLHMLEIMPDKAHSVKYLDSLSKQMDSLESLIGIARQLAVTPESIIHNMQPADLNPMIETMDRRLNSNQTGAVHVETPKTPMLILANTAVLYETLLTLVAYCLQTRQDDHPLKIHNTAVNGYAQITVSGEGLALVPNLLTQAVVCVCEGPHGKCTLNTPRSFQQNLEELTLANAQRIISLHNGMTYIRNGNAQQDSALVIELPIMDEI